MYRRTTWFAGRPGRRLISHPIRIVQLGIALDADRVIPALGLQQIEERRNGKGGVSFFQLQSVAFDPAADRGREGRRRHRP